MRKMLDKLKKNKKSHFILKVLKHIKDEEYVDFFLNRETDPLLLEFKSKGDSYPEEKFYYITEAGKGYGFFAEFHATLSRLAFADAFGFTPVISWGRDFSYYDLKKGEDHANAFEWFFEQPMKYNTKDIEQASLVVDAKLVQAGWLDKKYHKQMDLSPEYEAEIARIYQKYIRFQEDVLKQLQEEEGALVGKKKTLGVHFRGTDFKLNYDNHPVSVKIEQEFSVIDQALKEQGFEQIFLATDEKETVEAFKERYGDIVVWYKDVFRGEGNVSVAFSESERSYHKYKLAYEVVRDVFTLSMCQGLVAGVSQVSICSRIMKRSHEEQYEFLNIIDNGKNYNERKFRKSR